MSKRATSIATALAVAAIAALICIGLWRSQDEAAPLVLVKTAALGLMDTDWQMQAVTRFDQADSAEDALGAAEEQIREIELLMNAHDANSEISRLNAAAAGAPFPLTADTLTVLSQARRFYEATDGAFDVTCGPLVKLWSRSRQAEPAAEAVSNALDRIGTHHLRFDPEGVTKLVEGLQVDLGGIAKGYAVDRAVQTLQSAGLPGGCVEGGGDLRCFGTTEARRAWVVGIRHPFAKGKKCAYLRVRNAAVTTSGDYARSYEISGRRYSHIVDPRTGRPVAGTPSVTVVSLATESHRPSAIEADAWSTGLSVLAAAMGPERALKTYLDQQDGLEAMIVVGTPERHELFVSDGFEALLVPDTKIELD